MPPTPAAPPPRPSTSSLAIAIGANLGDPIATFMAVRPRLEEELRAWAAAPLQLRWSPRFRTQPVGGPPGQPPFLNAVLLVRQGPAQGLAGTWPEPLALLERLLRLEAAFGRERRERWGPRHLDLDLLWCGDLAGRSPELELPHPRLGQRAFVLAPLAAIDPDFPLPGSPAGTPLTASAGLAALPRAALEPPPLVLAGGAGLARRALNRTQRPPPVTLGAPMARPMAPLPPPEPCTHLETTAALQARKVRFELNRVVLPIGIEGTYGVIRHPGASLAVPVLEDGRVVILRQYRFAVAGRLLEFPAGTLEEGEEPLDSMRRELEEETGYSASRWDPLGAMHPCPGYSDEVIHLFLARDLTLLQDRPPGDDDEDMEVLLLEPAQLDALLASGDEALDGKTVTAWYRARQLLGS